MLQLFGVGDDDDDDDDMVTTRCDVPMPKKVTCDVGSEQPRKRPKVAVLSTLWAQLLRSAFQQAGCCHSSEPLVLHSLCSGMGTDSYATKEPHCLWFQKYWIHVHAQGVSCILSRRSSLKS